MLDAAMQALEEYNRDPKHKKVYDISLFLTFHDTQS